MDYHLNMVKKIDQLDERLIQLLQEDARRSSDVLAKKLDVSPATIRRRVRVLIRLGVIKIAAIPDPAKIGLALAAVVAVRVAHNRLDSVLNALTASKEVDWVCTTTGRFDIMAMGHFHSTDELSKFVQNTLPGIHGIEDTETFICLDLRQQ